MCNLYTVNISQEAICGITVWNVAAVCLAAWLLAPGPSAAAPLGTPMASSPEGPAVLRVQANGVKAMARQAFTLIDEGRYEEAQALLDQALNLSRSRGGGNVGFERILRESKATILARTGHFEDAESELKAIIAETEGAHGRAAESNATPFAALGELHMKEGRWSEAGPLIERAAELTERGAGKNNPATGEMLNTLGVFYTQTA